MLVSNDEARQMYCPFKFSHLESREAEEANPKWLCEGLKCMAWQERVIPVREQAGYCRLAGKPENGV